jgi:hypothetical protein
MYVRAVRLLKRGAESATETFNVGVRMDYSRILERWRRSVDTA